MNEEYKNIHQLHCSEDNVNIELALQLIKPRFDGYCKWLAKDFIQKIIDAKVNLTYTVFKNNTNYCDYKRLLLFNLKFDDTKDIKTYIGTIFLEYGDGYTWIVTCSTKSYYSKFKEDCLYRKLNIITQLIRRQNWTKLYKVLKSFIKTILTLEIHGRLN